MDAQIRRIRRIRNLQYICKHVQQETVVIEKNAKSSQVDNKMFSSISRHHSLRSLASYSLL